MHLIKQQKQTLAIDCQYKKMWNRNRFHIFLYIAL